MPVYADSAIGEYVNVELVGQGGSATVYKAVNANQQLVAVKVLSGMWSADDLHRFSREQEAMHYLNDIDGVVPLLDVGVSSQGAPFIVMPYYQKGSLQSQLDNAGPLPEQQALRHILRLGEILAACHKRGIYHRDIKPGNILIDANDSLWLADFGITQIHDGQPLAANISYTPSFCPPEMHRVEKDAASGVAIDVYGLAATAWALLSGRAPFSNSVGPTDSLVRLMRIASDPVGSPGDQVSSTVASVIETAMAKDSTQRYQTIEEFIAQLHSPQPMVIAPSATRAIAGSHSSSTISNDELTRQVPYEEAVQLFSSEATQIQPQIEASGQAEDRKTKNLMLPLLAAAFVLTIIAGATFLWVAPGSGTPKAAPTPTADVANVATSLPGVESKQAVASQPEQAVTVPVEEQTTSTEKTAMSLAEVAAPTTAQPVLVDQLDLTISKWGLARTDGGVQKKVYFSYRCPSSSFDITYTFKLPRADNTCQPGEIVETSVTEPEVRKVGQVPFGQVITITIETRDGLKESQSVTFENPYKIKTGCYEETCEIETIE